MEINGKQLAIVAALAGAAWFILRKNSNAASTVVAATKPAVAPAAGTDGIWGGFGLGGSIFEAIGQQLGPAAPAPAAPAPAAAPTAAAPAPASSGGFTIGGGGTPASFNNPQPVGTRNPNDPGRMTAEEYAIYSGAVSRLPA